MTTSPKTPAVPTQDEMADAMGIDLKSVAQLNTLLNNDSPVELTVQQFRPFVPLFQSTAVLSRDERDRLSQEYLTLVERGYRPVHVVAVDTVGVKHVVLALPRLFITATLPTGPEHAQLANINANVNLMSDRPDHRAKAWTSYMSSFLQSQDNDTILESIRTATAETNRILTDFVRATGGTIAEAPPAAALPETEWSFEE